MFNIPPIHPVTVLIIGADGKQTSDFIDKHLTSHGTGLIVHRGLVFDPSGFSVRALQNKR